MTAFAPVVDNKLPDIRQNLHAIRQQRHLLTQSPLFEKLCQSIPSPVLILNRTRQVVWANQLAVELVGLANDRMLHGSRLEDFILDPHLISNTDRKPFEVEDEKFFLTVLEDTSSHAQRLNLERTFFHDLLNTAGGMQGLTGILQEATAEELPDLKDSVKNMADQLVEEILSQRDLLAAEMGDLKARPIPLNSSLVIENVINTYRTHSSTGHRKISLSSGAQNFHFHSDPVLLNRVMGNMVKNALEATREPAVVTIDCGQNPDEVWFSVHNQGFIPQDIQPHVFQQSYSTKGRGRGTGTFSMQLFSEKYLGGRIGFQSNAAAGTTFTVYLPTDGP
jgi:signal transduction histidine kinase